MTHNITAVWHVLVDGQWHAVDYEGYAPVNVRVGERLRPVTYRHLANGCEDAACSGVELLDLPSA